VTRDLDRLYPEERIAAGYDLAGVAFSVGALIRRPSGAPAGVVAAQSITALLDAGPLAPELLGPVQRRILDGLRSVVAGRPWPLAGAHPVLVRDGPGFRYRASAIDLEDQLLVGIAELLVIAGHRLSICQGDDDEGGERCGTLFVRTRRQTFCSATCAQRARNRRKKLRDAEVDAAPKREPLPSGRARR
jgi:hypothetical protein